MKHAAMITYETHVFVIVQINIFDVNTVIKKLYSECKSSFPDF